MSILGTSSFLVSSVSIFSSFDGDSLFFTDDPTVSSSFGFGFDFDLVSAGFAVPSFSDDMERTDSSEELSSSEAKDTTMSSGPDFDLVELMISLCY